jgi:hypothetical protein
MKHQFLLRFSKAQTGWGLRPVKEYAPSTHKMGSQQPVIGNPDPHESQSAVIRVHL